MSKNLVNMHALVVLLTRDMVDLRTLTCPYHYHHLTTMSSAPYPTLPYPVAQAQSTTGAAREAAERAAHEAEERLQAAKDKAKQARKLPDPYHGHCLCTKFLIA